MMLCCLVWTKNLRIFLFLFSASLFFSALGPTKVGARRVGLLMSDLHLYINLYKCLRTARHSFLVKYSLTLHYISRVYFAAVRFVCHHDTAGVLIFSNGHICAGFATHWFGLKKSKCIFSSFLPICSLVHLAPNKVGPRWVGFKMIHLHLKCLHTAGHSILVKFKVSLSY